MESEASFEMGTPTNTLIAYSKALSLLTIFLIAAGTIARLSPLLPDGRLFWQYMTEDGYLMQTIARNIASGLGMTTAAGTIETNGVQPLATFMFAGLHLIAGGSKAGGIALVMLFSAAVSLVSAYFLYRLARMVLTTQPAPKEIALVVAGLWFSAPLIVPTSMNGLETGVYYAVALGTLWYYLSITSGELGLSWKQRLTLGILLGITFLARNDAVFFIASLLFVHLMVGDRSAGQGARRLMDCLAAGTTSVVVASPWLVFNYRLYGSIVPISGTAQSHGAALGGNLHLVPSKLFEAATLYLPLPARLENNLLVTTIALVVLAAIVVNTWRLLRRSDATARRFFLTGFSFTAALAAYYGLFFGAPHFLTRYFSILSPFLWLATCVTVVSLGRHVPGEQRSLRTALNSVVALMTVVAVGFIGVAYARGHDHMHKQVIDWANANILDDEWVGAVQTGTLGYFHDRTINLDGKVNPTALRELLDKGHILDFVVRSEIDYIVDWVDMADWVNRTDLSPDFAREFEVVVKDKELNLAALRRKSVQAH